MNRYTKIVLVAAAFATSAASAFWPFSNDDEEQTPRISLLMKPVNELIDQAEDRKAEGAFSEATDLYREALNELQNVEFAHPEMVDTPAFATVKNKRAYINAALTTLQLRETTAADGLVTLSDTTELEKRIEADRKSEAERAEEEKKRVAAEKKAAEKKVAEKKAAAEKQATKKKSAEKKVAEKRDVEKKSVKKQPAAPAKPESNAMRLRRQAAVEKVPANPGALNRFAAKALGRGETEAAELALQRCIRLFPDSHFAYYNLAKLMKSKNAAAEDVREIYAAGRAVGGPVDRELERYVSAEAE